MRTILTLLPLLLLAAPAVAQPNGDMARWRAEAARVTIVRDDWGIAHVRGRTDADAVFGMIYAQAEDDFNRVEANYLTALGRTAEAEGESAIWADLRARLYMQPDKLKADYAASPPWLKRLMDAWADGLNYYLATHPDVHPRVIAHFEPWMALSFTEGSIGGDIERIDLAKLADFYGRPRGDIAAALPRREPEPGGSNGMAIAPANTVGHHALLLINPHTSFFFRSELQMTSGEGLNAYGAATWGQFFLYQGFNPHVGWMHTSSGVDSVDEFAETMVSRGGRLFYRYGTQLRPVVRERIDVPYRAADGTKTHRSFTIFRTHHGPIVRAEGGKWIAFAMMDKPIPALEQSYLRTKTHNLVSFLKIAALQANSSNNTIFADDKGEIAYLHPQFIPVRDNRFDYTKPVDGSDPRTDWHGLHGVLDSPHVIDPKSGWLYNSNNWPYSAAGPDSPRAADYPRYMDTAGESPRGLHAIRVLQGRKDFTIERLRAAAYDSYLTAFARLVPGLVRAWDESSGLQKARVADQIGVLRGWDYRWGVDSVPTSLAIYWGEEMVKRAAGGQFLPGLETYDRINAAPAATKLEALAAASEHLEQDFGTWRTPWGEINRFERLNDDIAPHFTDAGTSIPVGFPWSRWGTLASFAARTYPGTKRRYGTSGNSFVAVVEFGLRVHAIAVTAGGESGHPGSPHFNDEAQRYATGNLRPVYFWPDELKGHVERTYRPGQ
ncbi:MAG TPA: penicillin acylase family protein [Allosphingosinicella sp.]|jgi:acyl-homoserine-lactone acylase|nr:penicillin acylase family protein [Allosphingosinicella sp.]